MKKLMLAVAMVALIAAPSFAAVQNVKVGGDIITTSVLRDGFNFFGSDTGRQNEILAQTRLKVTADLTDNVSTTVSLTNERLWGNGGSSDNTVGVESAYVTMKELFYAPLTLVVGRQPLAYGNQLIIGQSTTGFSQPMSDLTFTSGFDAVKAVLTYDPLTVDLFASRIDNGSSVNNTGNGTHDNTNLYGINANYKLGDKMSTVVEGYVFAKTQDATTATNSNSTYVPGLRLSTNPIEGLNVQLEGAMQFGRNDGDGDSDNSGSNQHRDAFAI